MNTLKDTVVVLLSAMTMGCNGWTSKPMESSPLNSWNGSKIFFADKCKVSTPPPPLSDTAGSASTSDENAALGLVTALVPEIASKITDFAAAYLEKTGEEFGASVSQATHLRLSRNSGPLGCLTFVVGQFGSGTAEPTDKWTSETLESFGLLRKPAVYVEWWLQMADRTGTHVVLQPRHFVYDATSAKRTSANGRKDVAFVVQLTQPVAKAAGVPPAVVKAKPASGGGGSPAAMDSSQDADKAVAGFSHSFQGLKIGSTLDQKALVGTASTAQPIPLQTKGELVVNVQITMLETENGGDFYLKLSKFISDSKSKINPELEKLIRGLLPKQDAK